MLPKRQARHDDAIQILDQCAEIFRLARRRGGQGVADLARPGLRHHRPVGQALVIVGEPVDELMAVAAEIFGRHERPCGLDERSAWRACASLIHQADERFRRRDRERAGLALAEHCDWRLRARQIVARRAVRPDVRSRRSTVSEGSGERSAAAASACAAGSSSGPSITTEPPRASMSALISVSGLPPSPSGSPETERMRPSAASPQRASSVRCQRRTNVSARSPIPEGVAPSCAWRGRAPGTSAASLAVR